MGLRRRVIRLERVVEKVVAEMTLGKENNNTQVDELISKIGNLKGANSRLSEIWRGKNGSGFTR